MIKEIILKGIKNGGFTIDKDLKEIQEKSGFMVSLYGFEKTYNINSNYMNDLIIDVLKYQELIKDKKNMFIGLWVDNDIVYLDLSKHYKNKQKAMLNGINNEQLSIYDIKNNSCIDLTKNVYILYAYNKATNDLQYITESTNINDLQRFSNKAIKNLYDYVTSDIEAINNLLNDKYIIFRDKIAISEL